MNCLEQNSSMLPSSTSVEFFDFSRRYSWKKKLQDKLKKIRPLVRRRTASNSHMERHPIVSQESLEQNDNDVSASLQQSGLSGLPSKLSSDVSGLSGVSGQIPGMHKMPTYRFDFSSDVPVLNLFKTAGRGNFQAPSASSGYWKEGLQAPSATSDYQSASNYLTLGQASSAPSASEILQASVTSGYQSASTLSESLQDRVSNEKLQADYQPSLSTASEKPEAPSDLQMRWSASNPLVFIQAPPTSLPSSSSSSLQQSDIPNTADLKFTEEKQTMDPHTITAEYSTEMRRRPHHTGVSCLDPIMEVSLALPKLRDTSEGTRVTLV